MWIIQYSDVFHKDSVHTSGSLEGWNLVNAKKMS